MESPELAEPAARVAMLGIPRTDDAGRDRREPQELTGSPVATARPDRKAGLPRRASHHWSLFLGRGFPPHSANCSTTPWGPTSHRAQSDGLEGFTRTGAGPPSSTVSWSSRWPRISRQAIKSTPVPTANTMSSALGSRIFDPIHA